MTGGKGISRFFNPVILDQTAKLDRRRLLSQNIGQHLAAELFLATGIKLTRAHSQRSVPIFSRQPDDVGAGNLELHFQNMFIDQSSTTVADQDDQQNDARFQKSALRSNVFTTDEQYQQHGDDRNSISSG